MDIFNLRLGITSAEATKLFNSFPVRVAWLNVQCKVTFIIFRATVFDGYSFAVSVYRRGKQTFKL